MGGGVAADVGDEVPHYMYRVYGVGYGAGQEVG